MAKYKKLSKSDLSTPEMEERARVAAAKMKEAKSPHFQPGTDIWHNGSKGTIIDVLTCKCRYADKALRIRWEDGTMGVVRPIALNPGGLGHA